MEQRGLSICAVILAGGKSSRFGNCKSRIGFNGVPVIRMIENAIRRAGINEIYISANDVAAFEKFGMPVVRDVCEDCGPISGIHGIFTNTDVDEILITACDMPGITDLELRRIIDTAAANPDADVIFARTPSGTHPLCAVARRTILPEMEKAIESRKFSVNELFKASTNTMVFFDNEKPFANLNTPEDLKNWEVNQDAE
jgi:molybdopterin-guanine dinucleotide biosynthesis protein A